MELSHRDVTEILELVQSARLEHFELEFNGTRIVASSRAPIPHATDVRADVRVSTEDARDLATIGEDSSAPTPEADASASVQRSDDLPQDAREPAHPDERLITAPVVGIFYVSPEPGANPYVQVGDTVEEGETIGLVEVMKVFNSVTSDFSGEITAILVKNEEFVEFGQPLFRLRPLSSE